MKNVNSSALYEYDVYVSAGAINSSLTSDIHIMQNQQKAKRAHAYHNVISKMFQRDLHVNDVANVEMYFTKNNMTNDSDRDSENHMRKTYNCGMLVTFNRQNNKEIKGNFHNAEI